MKQLTKAEEEIMQILWELEEANVASVIEQMPEPKPAYNTVSTIVRILESKGFVDHRKEGKGYIYLPLINKETYSNQSMNKLMNNYFDGSFKSMVSFFMKNNKLDTRELEEILKEINKEEE
ncbi:MAG: BlaI/MecI/CopY family transcriptional regulator [Gillisia sp.]